MHLPQDGSFLSHFFFLRLQFKQTLDDFAPPSDDGDGGSEAGTWTDAELCIADDIRTARDGQANVGTVKPKGAGFHTHKVQGLATIYRGIFGTSIKGCIYMWYVRASSLTHPGYPEG